MKTKKTNSEIDLRFLNKYVLKADSEKSEWMFTGEIWSAIEEYIEANFVSKEGIKKSIMNMLKDTDQFLYTDVQKRIDVSLENINKSIYNQSLVDLLQKLKL